MATVTKQWENGDLLTLVTSAGGIAVTSAENLTGEDREMTIRVQTTNQGTKAFQDVLIKQSKRPFDPVLYNNGYEGVEWEQGFTAGTSGTNWLLDKSLGYLGAQAMATPAGGEAAWTTKNPIDLSSFTNLKIVLDIQAIPSNKFRVGVFISSSKNNTAYGNISYIQRTFEKYLYYQTGHTTNTTYNLAISDLQGEYYISVHAVKIASGAYTGWIRVKELILT